jgi:hypothetical protein
MKEKRKEIQVPFSALDPTLRPCMHEAPCDKSSQKAWLMGGPE